MGDLHQLATSRTHEDGRQLGADIGTEDARGGLFHRLAGQGLVDQLEHQRTFAQ